MSACSTATREDGTIGVSEANCVCDAHAGLKHIAYSSARVSFERLRQTEVEDLDPVLVRLLEGLRDLSCDPIDSLTGIAPRLRCSARSSPFTYSMASAIVPSPSSSPWMA